MKPLETLRALGPGNEPPEESKQRITLALFAALEATALASTSTVAQQPTLSPKPAAPASLLGGVAGSKALAVAAGIWVIGGVSGAALYGMLRPIPEHVVYVERAAPAHSSGTPERSAASAPSAALVAGAASVSAAAAGALPGTPPVDAGRATLGSGGEGHSELARERALLDRARAAAAHGEPAQALSNAELHRVRFPRGRLSEEREALAIRALLTLGREAEARRRAQAFQASYPDSFLNPALESAFSGR